MKKFYPVFALVLSLAILEGCKSASKSYNKGNYHEAVDIAVKKLQKDPHNEELKYVLRKAYKAAIEDHESRIRQHSNGSNELKWEFIHSEYASMQNLYEAIRRSPEAYSAIQPKEYSVELEEYSIKAADVRIDRGTKWMVRPDVKGDRVNYRNAYNEFYAASQFRRNDSRIMDMMEEAYELAVVNIVIAPFNDFGFRFTSNHDNALRNLENEILRNLRHHAGGKFTKFYSQWDAQTKNLKIDQFIDFKMNTVNIGRTKDETNTREVYKDVVTKEIVHKPDSIEKVYSRVYAKITTTKRTMESDATLHVNIRDGRGKWLWNDQFRGSHKWVTEFASYTGDERALTDADKQTVNKQQQTPPNEEEVMRNLVNDIGNSLNLKIRDYYARY